MNDGLDIRGRYEQALAEVEEMKRRLREHAQHVASREKELEELRLDVAGRQGRRRTPASTPAPAPADPDRAGELAKKIAEAEKREQQAVQELALAKAERERLDEREQAIRRVERELAGRRVKLEQERAKLTGARASEPEPSPEPEGEPPPPTPLPQPPAEPDLEPVAEAKPRRRSSSTKAS